MVFRALALCFLLVSTLSFAQGRKPAVEDFVGIEIDQPEITPQGTESLYNLEQDLSQMDEKNNEVPQKKNIIASPHSTSWNMSTFIGISLLFGLPFMIWLMIMGHLRKKASIESASNIEVLEKYRKEREKKAEQTVRNVS